MENYIRTNHHLLSLLDDYLFVPGLSSEVLLRKRWTWIWLLVTFIGSLMSGVLFLVVFELWPLWWFALIFLMGYMVAIPIYRRARRFDLVINILFAYFIIITTIVMLQVGGLHSNLGFIFIGFNCALGSVLAGNLRWTIGLFALYCTSIVVVGVLEPLLITPAYITESIATATFVFMAIWINACILLLTIFFMKDHERFERLDIERLKSLDQAKTHLYNSVSHEFRTPLTIIKGVAELIEQNPRKWSVKGPSRIKAQAEILLDLVNQMLDISKLQARRMPLNLTQGDLNEYVCYIANSFCGLAETAGIALEIHPGPLPIHSAFDKDKIRKVLSNLLSNAIKFTPRGGHVTIEVQSVDDATISISVADNGIGIRDEYKDRIFDQFYQTPNDINRASGTGLGLTLVSQLVKLMHGDIKFESQLEKGSKFIVILPIISASIADRKSTPGDVVARRPRYPVQSAVTHTSPPFTPAISPGKPIILIVEDNQEVSNYLKEILEDAYNIEFAKNGEEGIGKAVDIIPDIIIADVMMPVMDGFQMIKQLRKDIRTDHIPIVVLTARGDMDSKLEGLGGGADHYIIKPFEVEELLLTLQNLLIARKTLQDKIYNPVNIQHLTGVRYRRGIEFVEKVHAILDKHLSEPDFNISDICDALHISRAQFYRKFSAVTSNSIGKYIRSYRLHKAKDLLENTASNVTEAAQSTGFRNASHFSAAFKQEFGSPPRDLLGQT